jgi:hypothetical protein
MHSFLWRFDFVDVSEIAREAGCNFQVWFSPALWSWCCQQSPRGPRFRNFTREGGILVSLASLMYFPSDIYPQVYGVATVGGNMFVNVVQLPVEDGDRRFAVMLPNEKQGRFIDS